MMANPLSYFDPARVRHLDIKHSNIGMQFFNERFCGFPIFSFSKHFDISSLF